MKKFLQISTIIIVSIGLLYLYARYIGTSGLEVKEYKIESASLPSGFHGLKIVHFSDLHYDEVIINQKEVKKIITKINELKPDIVVFTGDLIDNSDVINENSINFLKEELRKIEVTIGKYAIYGNHDYEVGTDLIKNIFNDSNFIVLENSYDTIYNKEDQILISGIDDIIFGSPNLDFLDLNNNFYQIVMVHEGDYAKDILEKNNDINLILAGHSHNGQVIIPFYGAIYTPKGSKIYYKEHYLINNTEMFVSSGIGVSRVNLRLFNKPSINFYRFYAKEKDSN